MVAQAAIGINGIRARWSARAVVVEGRSEAWALNDGGVHKPTRGEGHRRRGKSFEEDGGRRSRRAVDEQRGFFAAEEMERRGKRLKRIRDWWLVWRRHEMVGG
ncbi:hypothetical protein GOBAR_DD07458 [Gossypium barbadense]|nr:hypothetical protein GOBAR_DD07458 [Gossypium barbadense]